MYYKYIFFRTWFTGRLITLLLIETFYLSPILDVKTDRIISNSIAHPNIFHCLYIGTNMLKIIIALTGAFWLMNERAK
uniref:DUF4149 domain-containing protein n=1 Tax=Candidatus Berkiella cookevillensis TaxID=437022 RepID=A0A0Q9YN33_9GAMM